MSGSTIATQARFRNGADEVIPRAFRAFELDLRAGELHGDGQPILLPVQVFRVLRMLIEREGEMATREEIKKKLWPNDTVVEFDHGINTRHQEAAQGAGRLCRRPQIHRDHCRAAAIG